MSKRKSRTEKGWKGLFFRAFWITLLLLGSLAGLCLGSARAYEAVRQNGFGEKARAIELRREGEGVQLRFFDSEWRVE